MAGLSGSPTARTVPQPLPPATTRSTVAFPESCGGARILRFAEALRRVRSRTPRSPSSRGFRESGAETGAPPPARGSRYLGGRGGVPVRGGEGGGAPGAGAASAALSSRLLRPQLPQLAITRGVNERIWMRPAGREEGGERNLSEVSVQTSLSSTESVTCPGSVVPGAPGTTWKRTR